MKVVYRNSFSFRNQQMGNARKSWLDVPKMPWFDKKRFESTKKIVKISIITSMLFGITGLLLQ